MATAPGKIRRLITPLLIFLPALALRLIYIGEIRDAPLSLVLLGDAEIYDSWAREIAGGNWLGDAVFYQAPLYPYFLGLIYAIFGPDRILAYLIQAILGATACLFLAKAGENFFGPRAGLLAGALLAVYPTAIFADGLIQKSSLDIFLMSLLLLLLSATGLGKRRRFWFAVGLVLGGLALTRENALVLIAAAAAWLIARGEPKSPRRTAVRLIILAAGLALVLLPVAWRNWTVGGEFHLTTSQFGPNFYIGNNPRADGTYSPLISGHGQAFWESRDATKLAEQAMGRSLSPGEVSSYWSGKALQFIRTEPLQWLALMLRKALLLLNRIEVCDTEDQYSYGDWSRVLAILNPLLHFGSLVPMAVLGLVLTWPLRSRVWVLYLILGGYAASVILFYVLARYRLPLVPGLILFAAAGIQAAATLIRERGWRRLLPAAGTVALAAVIVNWPFSPDLALRIRVTVRNNIGAALMSRPEGREEALRSFAEAIRLAPGYADPYYNTGLTLRSLGRTAKAIPYLQRAVELVPDGLDEHLLLGKCYLDTNMAAQAEIQFRQALSLDPRSAEAHYGLGLAQLRLGRFDEAKTHLSEAKRLDSIFTPPP